GHFGAGYLADAATLEGSFERNGYCWSSADFPFDHDAAIIRLWRHALFDEPWRLNAIEGADELLPSTFIEEALSTGTSVQLDKAPTVDEIGNKSWRPHCSITTACSRRSNTLPGVAPASLM